MRCFVLLLGLLGVSTRALAQKTAFVAASPAAALAARDTLLAQAVAIRQLAFGKTEVVRHSQAARLRRRTALAGSTRRGTDGLLLTWKLTTRYRRNGRVQERFWVKAYPAQMESVLLLNESRLNGRTVWLSIPQYLPNGRGGVLRHLGLYHAPGYVLLDNLGYPLPQGL